MPASEFKTLVDRAILTLPSMNVSEEEEKKLIDRFTADYKATADDSAAIDRIAADSYTDYRRATGQGRYIPSEVPKGPWDMDGWDELDEDNKVLQIDKWRDNIPAMTMDAGVTSEDQSYYYNTVANLKQREAQGADTGRVADVGYRLFEGVGQVAASVMQNQELADAVFRFSESNPKYDDTLVSDIASGIGSTLPTIAVGSIVGAMTGGTGLLAGAAVGTSVLGFNAATFYGDAYLDAIKQGLDEDQAHRAGIGSLPGSVIDAMGDMFIVGKFLPGKLSNVLRTGTAAAKRDAIAEILANTSFRGSVINISKTAFAEGLTETVGDYTAGYGAFIATGEQSFIPDDKQLRKSFIVGSLIGGGFGGLSRATTERTLKKNAVAEGKALDAADLVSEESLSSEVSNLVDEGKIKEAADLVNKTDIKPLERENRSWAEMVLGPNSKSSTDEINRINTLGANLDELFEQKRLAESMSEEERTLDMDRLNQDIDSTIDQMFGAPAPVQQPEITSWNPYTHPSIGDGALTNRAEANRIADDLTKKSKNRVYRATKVENPDSTGFHFQLESRPLRKFDMTGETIARARDFELALRDKDRVTAATEAAMKEVESKNATDVSANLINQLLGIAPAPSQEQLVEEGPFETSEQAMEARKNLKEKGVKVRKEDGAYYLYRRLPAQEGVSQEGDAQGSAQFIAAQKALQEAEESNLEGDASTQRVDELLGVNNEQTINTANESAQAFAREGRFDFDPDDLIPEAEEFGLEIEEQYNSKFRRNPRRRGARGSVLLPSGEDIRNAIQSGAELFKAGFQRFSDWSGEMKNRFKDITTETLSSIWDSMKDAIVSLVSSIEFSNSSEPTTAFRNENAERVKSAIRDGQNPTTAIAGQFVLPENRQVQKSVQDHFTETQRKLKKQKDARGDINIYGEEPWVIEVGGQVSPTRITSIAKMREFANLFSGQNKTLRDLLMFTAANSPELKPLADKLIASFNDATLAVKIVDSAGTKNPDKNFFSTANNHIALKMNPFRSQDYKIFIHEAIHAATENWIQSQFQDAGLRAEIYSKVPGQSAEAMRKALDSNIDENLKDLIRLYFETSEAIGNKVDATYDYENRNREGFYGFTNLSEFLAEAFSNKAFQKALESVKSQNGNLWSRFKQFVANAFGLRTKDYRSALDDVLDLSSRIFEGNPSGVSARDRFTKEALAGVSTGYKSRSLLIEMPIKQFLSLAAPLKMLSRETAQNVIDSGGQLNEVPSLLINDFQAEWQGTSTVQGHEGRHRAQALLRAGYTTMPVEVRSSRIRWSEQTNPERMDYIENWPKKLLSEDQTSKIDYPLNRAGEWSPVDVFSDSQENVTENLKSKDPKIQREAKNKRKQQIGRLRKLQNLKVKDNVDANTRQIAGTLKNVRPKEIERLQPNHQDDFYNLVDHVFESRSATVADPAIRERFGDINNELGNYVELFDLAWIGRQIETYGGVVDMSAFQELIDQGKKVDRKDFEIYMNSTLNALGLNVAKGNERNKENKEKKDNAWREKYREGVSQITLDYPDAESWIINIYEQQDATPSEYMRSFLTDHFNYLTSAFDPETVDGGDLIRHFHALNNLLDGRVMYAPQTSVRWIVEKREASINISKLKGLFRDPVIERNDFLNGLDTLQRTMELKQTQLGRYSAFQAAKDWLQNVLMGGLFDSTLRVAQNMQKQSKDRYLALRKSFEQSIGREMNREDHIAICMVSRIIQFEAGQNANAAILANIENEWQAIYNITGDPKTKEGGRGSVAKRREKANFDIPILTHITRGIAESANPMQDFMASIHERLGIGEKKLGAERLELLQGAQSIMDQYSLEMEIVSEAFHHKPFKKQMNYLPRRAISINAEQTNNREVSLDDETEEFNEREYQANSMTATPEQLKERSVIGKNKTYSNNLEYILDRGVRIASLSVATTPERFILKRQLRKGGKTADVIEGSETTYRIHSLEQWASSLFQNAMQTGSPLGPIGKYTRVLREMFARVSLSGFHQIATQTASAFGDYHIRTNNIVGALQASEFYIRNKEAMDKWFADNASRVFDRSTLGEQELDKRKDPNPTESMLKENPVFKQFDKFYEGASKVLTYSLRTGDDFSAKAITLAEYVRLMQQKGHKIESIEDVDWGAVEGRILTQAMLDTEKVINSSDKITRGEMWSDRSKGLAVARDLTLAFASHQMTLAAQFSGAVRDLIDLHTKKAGKDEIVQQLRVMGGILGSSMIFSSSRFWINSVLATAMIGTLQSMFDDDDDKIYNLELKLQQARELGDDEKVATVQAELNAAKAVRKAIQAFDQRQRSGASYFQSVLKDELGSVHFVFAGPGIPQRLIFPVIDIYGEKMHKEAVNSETARLATQIKKEKERKNFRAAAKLSEQKFLLESSEYLPWHIKSFDSSGLGGVTGSALESTYANIKEFQEAAFGLREININDYILAASSAGIGQSDLNRFLKVIDKIEDEKMTKQGEAEENIKKAKARQQEQDERAAARRLRALMSDFDR